MNKLLAIASAFSGDLCDDLGYGDNDVGLLFTGYILAPANGDYPFFLSADTGALLRIHDATVLDADYGHVGGTEISGAIKLQARRILIPTASLRPFNAISLCGNKRRHGSTLWPT